MKRTLHFLACISVLLPGCGLYTGQNGSGPDGGGPLPDALICNGYGAPAGQSLRDPNTGQCVTFGGCDPNCGPCGTGAGGAEATPTSGSASIEPSWGLCTSQCTGLDENSCLATGGCRAAYIDTGESLTPGGDQPTKQYLGCWATDMSGPVEGGGCDGLDAVSCSLHDDCIAIHASTCLPGTQPNPASCLGDFQSCAPEPTTTGTCATDADCGTGYHCELPPGGFPCDCLPPPEGCSACEGTCVADSDPGNCYGDVTCTIPIPACPSGTTPGIKNGCYTGYCIPTDQCEMPPPPPACDTISDEATCIGRSDCTPIYRGQDCNCDPSGACTCTDWLFSGCQTTANGYPPPAPVDGGGAP